MRLFFLKGVLQEATRKEGKLKKKDLEEKPISEDEIPFEIPESWEWCRVKNILNVYSARRVHEKHTKKKRKTKDFVRKRKLPGTWNLKLGT